MLLEPRRRTAVQRLGIAASEPPAPLFQRRCFELLRLGRATGMTPLDWTRSSVSDLSKQNGVHSCPGLRSIH
eukprot:10379972-Alexandrium_andersonii.AAC.1